MEEGIVAGAKQGEDSLLAEGFGHAGVLVFGVEGTAEGPGGGGGGKEEVTRLMWTGQAV